MGNSIGVVVACHNEAPYIERAMRGLTVSLSGLDHRVVVIADRCTDESPAMARRFAEVVPKERSSWRNSYAENLNIGFEMLLSSDFIAIVDADMLVPPSFFIRAISELSRDRTAYAVSTALLTEPSSHYNSLYHAYELSMERVGLNKRKRKHGQRVFRGEAIRARHRATGRIFSDVLNPDSLLDRQTGGRVAVMGDVIVWSIRRTGLRKSLSGQLRQGKAQRSMGVPFSSLATEFLRFRPVVPFAFLLGRAPRSVPTQPEVGVLSDLPKRAKYRWYPIKGDATRPTSLISPRPLWMISRSTSSIAPSAGATVK